MHQLTAVSHTFTLNAINWPRDHFFPHPPSLDHCLKSHSNASKSYKWRLGMNAQTTYLHHSPTPLEGTTSDRGRRPEKLQFSHKPYYSSVRTTAAEGADMFHFVTSAGDIKVYVWVASKSRYSNSHLGIATLTKHEVNFIFNIYSSMYAKHTRTGCPVQLYTVVRVPSK